MLPKGFREMHQGLPSGTRGCLLVPRRTPPAVKPVVYSGVHQYAHVVSPRQCLAGFLHGSSRDVAIFFGKMKEQGARDIGHQVKPLVNTATVVTDGSIYAGPRGGDKGEHAAHAETH